MSLYGSSYQPRNKLRREGIERTVLPPLPGGHTYSAAYTFAGVGHTGYQQQSTTGSSSAASVLTGGTSSRGGGRGLGGGGLLSSSGAGVRDRIEEVKERQKERRERQKERNRRPDELSKSNLKIDADGIAHDSEYVQFRTATPVHVQARTARRTKREIDGIPNDDDSASSASSSSSSTSSQGSTGFQSSPYTYQSTHRTTTSTSTRHHHHSSTLYPPTRSAIPSYLEHQGQGYGRTSLESGGGGVPRAPSIPSTKRSSKEYDRSSLEHRTSSSLRQPPMTRSHQRPQQTTSSFQPPAPSHPHPHTHTLSFVQPPPPAPLPLNPVNNSDDLHSLSSSTARLSLNPNTTTTGESGYNSFAKNSTKLKPQRGKREDGNLVDAGVHGMKRSWDGFKLDMRFGGHKIGKKLERKLNSAIG